jgi:hypothetical protein
MVITTRLSDDDTKWYVDSELYALSTPCDQAHLKDLTMVTVFFDGLGITTVYVKTEEAGQVIRKFAQLATRPF